MRSLRGVLLATLAVLLGLLSFGHLPADPVPGGFQLATSEAGLIEPETFIDSGPQGLVNTNDVSFQFSSDSGTSFECSLDGGGFGACTSPADYFNLSEGSHSFEVRATNELTGITDPTPASRSFTVDTVAPNTTIDSGPTGTTGSADASFSFSSNDVDATFECRLDSGSWSSCTSPREYTGLSSTSHTFSVRATDPAGNTDLSPPQQSWTIDTAPPNTTISNGPSGTTNSTTASFAFSSSESGSVFECQLDLGVWEPCTSSKSYSNLGEGPHTFRVKATDSVGNTDPSPDEQSWTVDTTPPNTSITGGPSGTDTSSSATFEFSSTEANSTFECQLDSGTWASCTSGKTYNSLSDGSHTFRVRATDEAGNTDPTEATRTWTIDAAPPNTTLEPGGPSGTVNSTSANFKFSSDDPGSTFQCRLDSPTWESCTSPAHYNGLAEGAHTFSVRAVDAAGNPDPTPPVRDWRIDITPPNTAIDSGPSGATTQNSASFSFSSTEPGSTLECQLDGGAWGSCTSPKSYNSLTDATHTFAVRATDAAGNTDPTPATSTWTVDASPPETTILAHPASLTNSSDATFTFSSNESGSSFECNLDSAGWQACTSPANYSGLSHGSHTFQARATDAIGNTDPSPDSFTWTIDQTAPNTAIDTGPAPLTNSTSATFTFSSTEGGSTFECQLDGGGWQSCSSPRSYQGLSDGSHLFSVRATDQAGNRDQSEATYNWTVLTAEPETFLDLAPSSPTNDNTPTFAFHSDDTGATFQCRLDGPGTTTGSYAACTSEKTYSAMADGAYTFYVRAINTVGNVDQTPASASFTVDTTAPNTSVTDGPSGLVNSASATFTFSSTEPGSTFKCKLEPEESSFTPCSSPQPYAGLAEGGHIFRVIAVDQLGHEDATPASRSFTVDTTPPDTTITSGPSGTTADETPTFTFSGSGGATSFECRFDSDPFVPCSSPYTPVGGLTNAAHTFEVRARDNAGNFDPSPASRSFTVNTLAPNTLITSAPSNPTKNTSASFSFAADEAGATFECQLDAGAWEACTSTKTYSGPLAQGSHTFQVRATDPEGHTDQTPAVHTWVIDTAAPQTTINTGPIQGSTVNSNLASFTFSSSEASSTFHCKLDGQSFVPCTSPASYSGLTDGQHTFRVKATDPAGNTDATEATRTWTVDTTIPETAITSAPPGFIAASSATFAFSSEPGVSFQCKLDRVGAPATAYASCTSTKQYTGLVDGSYTFSVYAVDAGGNADPTPATASFTVDLTKPVTSIDSRPEHPTDETSATFTFTADEPGATFECRLSGEADYTPCTSPITYTGLADGTHTFRVRAVDQAGNRDSSTTACQPPPAASGPCTRYDWSVDTTLPQTTIESSPSNPINSTSATFSFSSTAPDATFECKLDGDLTWTPCTSPDSFTGLSEGQHVFSVRAKDRAGNIDPVPATRTWRIDLTSPETAINSGPSTATTSSSATFAFSASESGSSFQCRIDGGEWGECSSPKIFADLQVGGHMFEVRAIDGAANVDASPAKRTWSVTAPPPAPVAVSGPQVLSPFPVVRISGKFTSRGVRLRLFQISVRGGMKVVIRCAPRRLCPFARHSRTATRGLKYQVRSAKFIRVRRLERRLLRAGIKLEVFITKPGMIGKYTRFKIRKAKPPKRTDRCLPPNSSKPVTCPS